MSATEQMRAMLDGLMGTARDGSDSQRQHLHFTDPRVCRPFLLDCCPHDVFAFTKLDLGECNRVHDPALRADYLNANKTKDYMYEVSALERLQTFVADSDRKTDLLKRRLAETQEELTAEETSKLDKVHELTEKLGKKLAQLDKAVTEDDAEAKQKLTDEAERIKKKRALAEAEYRKVSRPASSHQQQNLRVCDICAAYLGINDNDSRLADHYGGKLHLGFLEIREKLEDLKKIVATKQPKRGQINDKSAIDHRRSVDREHERPRDNYRRDDREPYFNDRHPRDYERNRDRDRDRLRYRDKIRDRELDMERERERDRYRDRDRERDRSRSGSRHYYREPSRDIRPPRDRPEPRYRDDRVERIDRPDRISREDREYPDNRKQEREIIYQKRLRDWEKRELDKARRLTARVEEERDRKLLEEHESKKLKEFLEDYNDDRDDIRYYRGSALARRISERQKEIELDEASCERERLKLKMLSKECSIENNQDDQSSPRAIECANNISNKNENNYADHDNGIVEESTGSNKSDSVPTNQLSTSSNEVNPPPPPPQKVVPPENKKEQVEKLIERIPTVKEELFAWPLDWTLLDENLMEKRIKPWIAKKIAFFFDDMGEKEADLISWICKSLNGHADGNSILNQVAMVLEDDAEKFVVQMWRLLVFELEAKSRGLRK